MKKILLIEDNKDIREELSTLLSLEHFNVLQASNGAEGIEIAEKEKPDLILCDILMEGINGFEVFSTIRKNPETSNTYFIFVTALPSHEFIKELSEHQFTGYVRKPFEFPELLKLIKKVFK